MMKMKPKLLRLIIALVSVVFLAVLVGFVSMFLGPSNSRDNQDPAKQKEMMELILEGGRLSPFPASATNVSIKTEGNSFARSFRAGFSASKEDILSWIEGSPGLNEITPVEVSANKVQYIIAPDGGANRVEVTIDYDLNEVEIYVSWG